MEANCEVIALVLDDSEHARGQRRSLEGAQRLIRNPDGRVCLEDIESEEEFERMARTTGCFRRGKAILDPDTHEIMGYELEEVRLV